MFRTQIKASVVAANQERSPEFALWQAVIAQAITDANMMVLGNLIWNVNAWQLLGFLIVQKTLKQFVNMQI